MGKARRCSKLIGFIASPIRILGKARDLYVRSITRCADGGNYGYAIGYHGVDSVAFPKSFSVGSHRSSDRDDFKEQAKGASVMSVGRSILEIGSEDLPKCRGGQMGRIDEDKACEFGEDLGIPMAAYLKGIAAPSRKDVAVEF